MPVSDAVPAGRRVKLTLAYDGTDFHGWQFQPQLRTVEGAVESALSELAGARVDVDGASRTDQGVHALGQTVSFDLAAPIPTQRLAAALNGRLPADVRAVSAGDAGAAFHARHSAVGKCYRYLLDCRPVPSVFLCRYALHVPAPLDVERMEEAAAAFVGEQDFQAFQGQSGQTPSSTVRRVDAVVLRRWADLIGVEVWGRSFLYKMVRAMVGTLLEVGLGRWPPSRVAYALASRDRAQAGPTAPAHGLVLREIHYDLECWHRAVLGAVDAARQQSYHSLPI